MTTTVENALPALTRCETAERMGDCGLNGTACYRCMAFYATMDRNILKARVEDLERAVKEEEAYHGKTVRVIGQILGIDPAINGEPVNFLTAVATVVRVRDKARAEIDALRAACRCLEWERNTARAKVAEQGAELGRVRAQLEDLAERAIPCIELAQEIPDDDEDAAEILHTLEVATGTLQALAIEALSAPEPKKEG